MSENTNIDGLKGLNFYLSKAGIDKAKLIDDENNTDSLVDIFNATEGGGSAKDPTKFVREFCNTYKDNMKNLEYDELFAFQGIMQDAVSSLEGDADSFEVSDVEKLAEILNSNDPKTRSILDNDPSAKYSADEIGIFTETYGISEDDAIQILDELHAQDNIMGNVDSSIQLLPDSTQTTDPVDTNSADNKEITQTAGAASPVSGVQTDSEAIENSNNENTQNVSSADTQVLDEKALRTLFGHSGKLFTSDFTSLSDTDKAQQANDFAKIMFSGYDIFGTKEEEPRIKNISDCLALAEYYVDTYKENHVSKSLIEAFSVDDASTDAYIGMYESLMGTDKEQEAIDLLCRYVILFLAIKQKYRTSEKS